MCEYADTRLELDFIRALRSLLQHLEILCVFEPSLRAVSY